MTLKQLEERVRVKIANGYCSYEVTINYRGKEYKCHSNNSLAWDRQSCDDVHPQITLFSYTLKGALNSFYEECKRKNNIGEYKY